MRKRFPVLVAMVVMLAMTLASGVALAVNKLGTDGPDTLRGTNGDDNLLGRGREPRPDGLGLCRMLQAVFREDPFHALG